MVSTMKIAGLLGLVTFTGVVGGTPAVLFLLAIISSIALLAALETFLPTLIGLAVQLGFYVFIAYFVVKAVLWIA